MKVIAYSNPDSTVSIVCPAPQANVVRDFRIAGNNAQADTIEQMTNDQFVAWVRDKDVPVGATNVQIIDTADLPQDRTQRSAWRLT